MLTRMTVYLTLQERDAISFIAHDEMRDIREQTHWLLRQELARRGMFPQALPIEPDPQAEALAKEIRP